MQQIGHFIQYQILGMQWLNTLIGRLLTACGLDINQRLGGSLQFFIYDTIKIFILLIFLIFIISYIQSYFPPARSKKILGRFQGLPANTLSALLGTVTPFCSCSSIPLFMGFSRAGLPLGVTFSFLISSPMVDLGSLILLASIFGFKIALVYVLLGLLIAIIGGTIIDKLHMEKYIADFIKNPEQEDDGFSPLQTRANYAWIQVIKTLQKVYLYIFIGVAIGAVIHNWIPQNWIESILGNHNPFSVLLAVLAGAPMYADIFGAIPIAEALYAKQASLGTILAFMMAVTTLSLPSLILLSKAIKPKLLLLFIAICLIGMILTGYLFNLYDFLCLTKL